MSTATEQKTLNDYAQELGVTMKAVKVSAPETADEWQKKAQAYRLDFTRGDNRESFRYYQGQAFTDAPDINRGLECLVSDYRCLESCPTLEDFGDEFGWDKTTNKTFKALQKNASKLEELFTKSELSEMVRIVEEA
jgi:hypothetical protein